MKRLWVLIALMCLAGCEKSTPTSPSSGSATTIELRGQRIFLEDPRQNPSAPMLSPVGSVYPFARNGRYSVEVQYSYAKICDRKIETSFAIDQPFRISGATNCAGGFNTNTCSSTVDACWDPAYRTGVVVAMMINVSVDSDPQRMPAGTYTLLGRIRELSISGAVMNEISAPFTVQVP